MMASSSMMAAARTAGRRSAQLLSRGSGVIRSLSVSTQQQGDHVHFKNSPKPHPLGVQKEWLNPTHNKVWSDAEIEEGLATQPRHQPQLLTEKILSGGIHTAYYLFNKATGYVASDPTPESIITRLLFLESIAGVPGMVAAQHRHMASLRTMSRDYGWIHTLLEEVREGDSLKNLSPDLLLTRHILL